MNIGKVSEPCATTLGVTPDCWTVVLITDKPLTTSIVPGEAKVNDVSLHYSCVAHANHHAKPIDLLPRQKCEFMIPPSDFWTHKPSFYNELNKAYEFMNELEMCRTLEERHILLGDLVESKDDKNFLKQIHSFLQETHKHNRLNIATDVSKRWFVRGLIDGISTFINVPQADTGKEIGWTNVFGEIVEWQPNEKWTRNLYMAKVSRTDVQTALFKVDFPAKDQKEYAAAATVFLSR